MSAPAETCDAVIVGSRCAGSAAAIALARNGRKVIALDRAKFPSDTLSTHLLFPAGVSELARLGALERISQLDPPRYREIILTADGAEVRERMTAVDGIDYGICVPRPELDDALVTTARGFGVDVRERCSVEEIVWEAGRAAGVRYRDADGETRTLHAKLVIGADGRRSSVAEMVGANTPYRGSRNERGLAFKYMDDPKVGTEWREIVVQYREGATHGMCFPCPDGRMLVLFMGPAEEIKEFRAGEEKWNRMVAENPALARRIEGATNATKLRSTPDTAAYFRASSGPGWALAGDAGHFKDPVIAQGIRDALRFGRLLGEAAAPVLDDPAKLDAALLSAEKRRDRECQATYHWGNRESRAQPSSPLVVEALRVFGRTSEPDLMDTFNRVRVPERVIHPLIGAKALVRALRRPGADRVALLREAYEETLLDLDVRRERLRGAFRESRPALSERRDYTWPGAPTKAKPAAATVTTTTASEPAESAAPVADAALT
jgi:2-polyprenyl-6-methoxyphenol hydroxylase-like FAD-dependent oxidoreductase